MENYNPNFKPKIFADKFNQPDKTEISKIFARIFGTLEGQRALEYLYSITFDRHFGAETPENILRYIEGQKGLIHHIETLILFGKKGEFTNKTVDNNYNF